MMQVTEPSSRGGEETGWCIEWLVSGDSLCEGPDAEEAGACRRFWTASLSQ